MVKKVIHDQLITDFSALTFTDGVGTFSFTSVRKAYHDTYSPLECLIIPAEPRNEITGNSFDHRTYAFSAFFYEELEGSASQAELNLRVDKLSLIEDGILNYLQKVPYNLRTNLNGDLPSGFSVINTTIEPAIYRYAVKDSGTILECEIRFDVVVNVDVKLL